MDLRDVGAHLAKKGRSYTLRVPALAFIALTCGVAAVFVVGCAGSKGPPPGPASPLPDWRIVGRSAFAYEAAMDATVTRNGRPTVRFQYNWDRLTYDCFRPPCPSIYAGFVTSRDATPFRGRRVRAAVWIRTAEPEIFKRAKNNGYVGLRVVPLDTVPGGPWTATSILPLDRNSDFRRYELSVDVPQDAARIELGASPNIALWIDPNDVRIDAL